MNKQCFIYINIVSTACIGGAWGHWEATRDGNNEGNVLNQGFWKKWYRRWVVS